MAISLSKGGNVSLTKEAPGLSEVVVGLGWDPRVTDGTEFDLDASVFITGENGKVLSDTSFIFYNNKISTDGSVEHLGDNRSGRGAGDDEQVNVKLNSLAADVKKLIFAVTIHDAEGRKQSFGQVSNATGADVVAAEEHLRQDQQVCAVLHRLPRCLFQTLH